MTGRGKCAIEDHLDTSHEIEIERVARNRKALLEIVRGIGPARVGCCQVRQTMASGLGHAVSCAERLAADNPFAVVPADGPMYGARPEVRQRVEVFDHPHGSVGEAIEPGGGAS